MKRLASMLVLLGLGAFMLGCTAESRLENAQEDLQEERIDTAETINEATQDGTVTPGEQQEIREEQGETVEAAGDTAEAAGDVIDKQTD
jgi:hypothetical protein